MKGKVFAMASNARLALSSITYAMQAKELLAKYAIESSIIRLRPDETPTGCAFGLVIPRPKLSAAAELLSKAQVEFKFVGR